jgi:hypothetical protein
MTVNRERKMRTVIGSYLDFDGVSLKDARKEIDRLFKKYGDTARINKEPRFDEGWDLVVNYTIPETDDQMAVRIAKEEAREQELLRREQAQFERLKTKFA